MYIEKSKYQNFKANVYGFFLMIVDINTISKKKLRKI